MEKLNISEFSATSPTSASGTTGGTSQSRKLNRILLIATGALTNATTSQQGESIPGIAHAVAIEN